MAKVIAFPEKKQLSRELKERLYGVAKDYIDVLYDALDGFVDDEYDYEGFKEVNEMVAKIYQEGLNIAIDEMEEEL